MKSYIILRDNKESRPYTFKDLEFFGINSSDLIWIEEESTAWLYPDDITELAGLASKGQKKIIPERLEMTQAAVSKAMVLNSELLQTEDSNTAYSPENVSIYSTGKSRSRRSVSGGASLFGFIVLLIGTAFCAFVIKKMIGGFDDTGFSATSQAKTIQEEMLLPSMSSHAARMINIPILMQTISDTSLVKKETTPLKPIISKAVLITAPAKEKLPEINKAIINVDSGTEESSNVVNAEQPLEKANEEKEIITPPKPAPSVQVSANDYSVGIFGGISNLELSVTNPSSQVIQRAIVEVEFLKPNGSVVKSQTLSVENISPGSSKKLVVPASSRGVKVRYKVVSVQADEKVAATDI